MKNIHISIILVFLAFTQCKQPHPNNTIGTNSDSLNIVNVKTAAVIHGNIDQSVDVLGVVLSETEARPSFKTGGVINRVYVEEGQYVKKGQLIATLLMNEIDAQVRQAEEGLSKAERDVNQ